MKERKILIVEDEVVVSTDLKIKLKRIGYDIVGCLRYGEEALEKAEETGAEMVIMDINLKGPMDGTEAAGMISEKLGIPIIFLTAYSDQDTIVKAKKSSPFGYLRKPVRLEDLTISLEIAFYKYDMEKKLQESEIRFRTVADYTRNWETWINQDDIMEYMSPSCLRITGYTRQEFLENPDLLYDIIETDESKSNLKNHNRNTEDPLHLEFMIRNKSGELRWIEHVCQPVFSPSGEFMGRRGSNTDITQRKQAEQTREDLITELEDALEKVKTLKGMLPICCSCKKIRDDEGYWNQIETYMSQHSEVEFSHSICPDCAKKLYPQYYKP